MPRSRAPASSLVHHSDRGSQYTGRSYRVLLDEYGIVCSLSRAGNGYDNAPMESFFGTCEQECAHHAAWLGVEDARAATHDHIGVSYNRERSHSSSGYRTPAEAEPDVA